MGALFGTDGIRGKANVHPMTPDMAVRIGRAVAEHFIRATDRTDFVIGRDTRASGTMLECAIAAGICSAGGNVLSAGVIPTPAVAHLTGTHGAAAGIVISASHNPYHDNGIKLFSGEGTKLDDGIETIIEEQILADAGHPGGGDGPVGRYAHMAQPVEQYLEFLLKSVPTVPSLDGLTVVLDCANGAASTVAPALFDRLGARTIILGNRPDGININDGCGSEHTPGLEAAVRSEKADIGFAFDGDADRVIAVDENGRRVSGDQLIAVLAKHYQEGGRLPHNTVVTTVMSNLGLKQTLAAMGIRHVVTGVGDRYVMAAMAEAGAVLGGEDSGHIICRDVHTTGDGILSSLKILSAMTDAGAPLSQLAGIMPIFPQTLLAVDVTEKPDLDTLSDVREAIRTVEERLGETGRVLVRYSGTQPVCRVMVEGPDLGEIQAMAESIAQTIARVIGA